MPHNGSRISLITQGLEILILIGVCNPKSQGNLNRISPCPTRKIILNLDLNVAKFIIKIGLGILSLKGVEILS